ncbi:MAG: phospholipase D family protein [Xanthomonadaceae bacterium]|nr:phospholipase D family protein [Xanthomonadaceae bacterium]
MSNWLRIVILGLALLSSACVSLSSRQHARVADIATASRSQEVNCDAVDRCAQPSPLRALADAAFVESTEQTPRHYALILDNGEDALLARVNLIRSATRHIDLQTYIFDKDDSAYLIIDELLTAAKRGVQIRVLIDQLSAISDLRILAALSGAHQNFELRVYNPTFGLATPNYFHYAASVVCCFRRFNQRMHNKLLLIDSAVGITGGRNYQDDYYDWDSKYNFRDRDVLVAGPVVKEMAQSFEAYWRAPRSIPVERLNDVGLTLLREGVPQLPESNPKQPERVQRIQMEADDTELIEMLFVHEALPIGSVAFISDLPEKHQSRPRRTAAPVDPKLGQLLENAQEEILLQTPYLVLSKPARDLFREMRTRPLPPRVIVSTNSLAATDNPVVYSVAFKYKRRNMRDFGFEIYELKPFPQNAPVNHIGMWPDLLAMEDANPPQNTPPSPRGRSYRYGDEGDANELTRKQRTETRGSLLRGSTIGNKLMPVHGAGARMGLHAKSMVIDRHVAVIGTHNFDPRSENYNTEGIIVIKDAAFAEALARSIERDIEPENSWIVAPRIRPPVLSGLNYSVGKVSEAMPILDIWPWRYATNYDFRPGPGCPNPLPSYRHPDFHKCYVQVGDFPEVDKGPKILLARMLMAIGAGLAVPIM